MAGPDPPDPDRPRRGVLDRDIPAALGVLEALQGLEEASTDRLHGLRRDAGEFIESKTPQFRDPRGNFEDGTLTGGIVATLVNILDDTALDAIGADTELVDADVQPDGSVIYTVNVDAAFENQARFQSKIEASNGYIGLFTDDIEVVDVEVVEKRPARDTYSFKIRV